MKLRIVATGQGTFLIYFALVAMDFIYSTYPSAIIVTKSRWV
jgi:hypothetical protein